MITIAALVVVAIIVAVVFFGQRQVGTWPPPPAHYDPPAGGYTCLPTCDETDGKFFLISNEGMDSFAGAKIVMWIAVPGDYTQFELSIFDGDSGKDDAGNINIEDGNWDSMENEATYTLYADPLKDGSGQTVAGVWHGNGDSMPNNDWYQITLNVAPEAMGPSRHYYYRLEVTQDIEVGGGNGFKLRSNGYVSTGRTDLVNASIALAGNLMTVQDVYILYPQFTEWTPEGLGPSTYTGDWQFYFYVRNDQKTLELWDGDFDRGSHVTLAADTDDPNTDGKPDWAGPGAVDEGAGGQGSPADDNRQPLYRREPPVNYTIIDPDDAPLYTNDEPSGTEEWERFVLSSDPAVQADLQVSELKEGFYGWHIEGLDLHNFVFFRTNFEVCDPEEADCGPPEWPEGVCPSTMGYWSKMVKRVLINDNTRQPETEESLHWALDIVAQASPLFRQGINLSDPQPIDTIARLTDEEANIILQRRPENYPGADNTTMLARALQQNLASWLNLSSSEGKLGSTTVVELNVQGGPFEGIVWQALQEVQQIIFDGGDMVRARDIGSQLNNGLLGEFAADSVCGDYEAVMPSALQPPTHEDMPIAGVEPEPPNPTPVPEPDTETCGARVNEYNVESPTDSPFYGIKFEFASGDEVKNSDLDLFEFTLTQAEVDGITSVQMEAKANNNVESGIVVLESCQFNQPLSCGEPVMDDDSQFAFNFMGTEDNGDGTFTLTFQVQNFSSEGLNQVTIGLPDGAVPSSPSGSYQSEVCPE